MFIQTLFSIILIMISIIGFIWGIVLNARYRNPYVLRNASGKDKWRWALYGSISFGLPIAGLLLANVLYSEGIDDIVPGILVVFTMFGFVILLMILWSRWDFERINKRNIRYSRKINDPTKQDSSKRLKQHNIFKLFLPADLARFQAFGFADDDMIEKDEE